MVQAASLRLKLEEIRRELAAARAELLTFDQNRAAERIFATILLVLQTVGISTNSLTLNNEE